MEIKLGLDAWGHQKPRIAVISACPPRPSTSFAPFIDNLNVSHQDVRCPCNHVHCMNGEENPSTDPCTTTQRMVLSHQQEVSIQGPLSLSLLTGSTQSQPPRWLQIMTSLLLLHDSVSTLMLKSNRPLHGRLARMQQLHVSALDFVQAKLFSMF